MSNCDVILVGYGPTSAILANVLGSYGWRVDVFERMAELHDLPRAVHFDGEVMRIFQRLQLADKIVTETEKVQGMDMLNAEGKLLSRYTASSGLSSQGWYEGYMFHQPALERTLREAVGRYPNVRVHLGTEIDSITVEGEAAVVRGSGPLGLTTASARYVVGCCGGRSITGAVIQTEPIDYRADQTWIVVDVKLLHDPGLPDVTVQYCDPARPSTYVPSPGLLRRFELMLLPAELAADMMTPERIGTLLSRWLQPSDYVVERAAVYTFHATLAGRWRKGRLLVAGDAAHQMPPFLGQGLGAGARDAVNLGWKLDLVLRGMANDTLLDTYQTERSPHVQATIESDLWLSNIIQTTDPEMARQRDLQMTAAGADGALVLPTPSLGEGLCGADAASGRPFIQPVLASGLLHDALLGDGFALLGATTPSAWAQHVLQWLGTRWVSDPAPEVMEWLHSHGATAVLVRPDRYVQALIHDTQSLDHALAPLAAHLCLDSVAA